MANQLKSWDAKPRAFHISEWQPVTEGVIVMKKRFLGLLLTLTIIFSIFTPEMFAMSNSTYAIDFTSSNMGVVKVLTYSATTAKLKVAVENGTQKYIYDMPARGSYVNYPLQLGNGQYTVKIYENTTGNKYKTVYTGTENVYISTPNSVYLASTQQVNWNNENQAIILAKKLLNDELYLKIVRTKNNQAKLTDNEKIKVIYNYVVKNMSYDYQKISTLTSDYVPSIDAVLQAKKGICFDYSALLASMLRSQGIPAKLVKGYSTTTDVYHAWNEIYLSAEGRWIIVDTTYDAYMYRAKSPYSMEKSVAQYTKQLEF